MNHFYAISPNSNPKFMKIAEFLIKNGVKNWGEHLQLKNPELAFVNPHCITLTKQQRAAIVQECMDNYWYFLREIVRIPHMGGSIEHPNFNLTPVSYAISYLLDKGVTDIIELNVKQQGTKQAFACRAVYEYLFNDNSCIDLYGKTRENANYMYMSIDSIMREIPDYIRAMSFTKTYKYEYAHYIKCGTSPSSAIEADTIGRGSTSTIMYLDDIPSMAHWHTLLASSAPYHNVICRQRRTKGIRVLSCHIPAHTNHEYFAMIKTMDMAAPFQWRLIDQPETLRTYLDSMSANGFMLVNFNYEQVGLTDEEKYEMEKILCNDPYIIDRELRLKFVGGELDGEEREEREKGEEVTRPEGEDSKGE